MVFEQSGVELKEHMFVLQKKIWFLALKKSTHLFKFLLICIW